MSEDSQRQLLAQLNENWRAFDPALALTMTSDAPAHGSEHPLSVQLDALKAGEAASLPYFVRDQVAWFTLAPNDTQMRKARSDLQAWVIPSWGWMEDPAFLAPSAVSAPLGKLILALSPTGYLRWRTLKVDFKSVVSKLALRQRLESRRPANVRPLQESLYELRGRFAAALAAGNRDEAEAAIDTIDREQLDAALNSHFMRLRLWHASGDYARIAAYPAMTQLLRSRMPRQVQQWVLTAFHTQHLAKLEETDSLDEAVHEFCAVVFPKIGPLLSNWPENTSATAEYRLLAYQSRSESNGDAARRLRTLHADDPWVNRLLAALAVDLVVPLVEIPPPTIPVEVQKVVTQTAPSNWAAWFSALDEHSASLSAEHKQALDQFLSEHPDQDLENISPALVEELAMSLERVFVNWVGSWPAQSTNLLRVGLSECFREYVREIGFPRAVLAPVYENFMRLWASLRQGSSFAPDGQILLELASAVLSQNPEMEREIVKLVEEWWQKRPVPALIPFLHEALEFLLAESRDHSACERLWVAAATLLKTHGATLSELRVWRRLGQSVGWESALDEYLPLPPDAEVQADPLGAAQLMKIAIVSLRERQARAAAETIATRTGANVVLVNETHKGPLTASALNADVVLLVWAATTHAVFYGLKELPKERLAYVASVGSQSIIYALERWVAENVAPVVAD